MGIYATNENAGSNIEYGGLLNANPFFYDILTEISGSEMLPGMEVFKEKKPGLYSARFKTHGYGIVITASTPSTDTDADIGYLYAIAKPLFRDPAEDNMIELIEGPLNFDTCYLFKDAMLQLMIIK